MKHTFLFWLLFALAFSSCTIEQRYYFNDDFSGRMEHVIDYSASADMIPPDEGAENGEVTLLEDSVIENITREMAELEGVRLNRISDENHVLTVELGFDHLDGLNKAMISESGDNENHNIFCQFEQKKNKLIIRFVVEEPETTPAENAEVDAMEEGSFDDQSFYEMIQYRFTFEFATAVKSHKGTPANIGNDGKSLVVEQNLLQLIADDFVSELEVVLN